MENGVLWNCFRAQCGPHFFSSHGKANGQTLEIILNAPLKPLFWFTFWLTRTLDKFVGTKSHRRRETSLLFSHPWVCSPPSSPDRALSVLPHQERSTAPALQLFSGVASFLLRKDTSFSGWMLPPQGPKELPPFCSQDHLLPQAHHASDAAGNTGGRCHRWRARPSPSSSRSLCWGSTFQSIILTTKEFCIS